MAKTFESFNDRLRSFIDQQKMFFVATAPLRPDGHINVSPKGLAGTFVVLDDRTIAYLDFAGSGVETIAHIRENGRICLMFCAFEGPPRIVRVHGTGDVLEPSDEEFERELAVVVAENEGRCSRCWLVLVQLRRGRIERM